eukprot:m.190639 g.190639  ORF g.190639 m.190639 type:complete len:104 (-) comp14825_c1_seq1:1453-1764(-)
MIDVVEMSVIGYDHMNHDCCLLHVINHGLSVAIIVEMNHALSLLVRVALAVLFLLRLQPTLMQPDGKVMLCCLLCSSELCRSQSIHMLVSVGLPAFPTLCARA